jgi:hypothetical protein
MSISERAVHLNRDLSTTQEEVLPANPVRRYALLVNDSDSDAYIALGIPAVANQGIRLNASGGSFEISNVNPFYGRIHAISTGATKRMMITEY